MIRDAIKASERAAAKAVLSELRRRFGFFATMAILARIGRAKLAGEPFRTAVQDERDRLSRKQCADLVLLDRAVRERAGPEAALEVARVAVLAGGPVFLAAMIPARGDLRALAPELAEKFFNAEGTSSFAGETFKFTVRRCRFQELLGEAGASHLLPLFCEVDRVHFEQGPIALRRERTLAGGGPSCDFEFSPR